MFLAEAQQSDTALLFSFSYCIHVSFLWSVQGHIFHTFCDVLVISPFQMVPQHNADILSSVPKCRKAVLGAMEKIRVSEELHLGRSQSAAGHELNVNESTIVLHKVLLNGDT